MAEKHFDIVIAGGAMAGATLALALSKFCDKTLSIAVIEPYQVDSNEHPGFDSRSIALSYGTTQILEAFGLWEQLLPDATPINTIHVSDKGHAGMTDIDSRDYGVQALGYVVELANVGRVYQHCIEQSSNIEFICPDSVASIDSQQHVTRITLESGNVIECALLVAADGAVSECCRLMKIDNQQVDFEQVAVIANIGVSQLHQDRAFERFTPNGPLALLPMSQNRMSLVWCLSADKAEQMMSATEDDFISELQSEFGWRLGAISHVGSRASYPLILHKKSQITAHRFATIGNAAQALHPIAGQGFNLGNRDVASLAEEISLSADPGSYETLSRYQKRRDADRNSTIDLTAGLVHIFSNEWLPMVVGRNLSLMAMDNIPALKSPLLNRTMGLVKR
ncbi:2-octaprenyl-6-methoxyphenyl hydroxylase [Vibrio hannami]|uniref:2-octaprenyl-6-methoxyphenyl hydroxylase n=1 Tax=Vibrio hannami TaxID=2717094 RepID=UPI00240FAB0A|nr:2-octaprenyl-6-methoxyphenyl hydroxylase [Vibrio hannami]MDG3087139.1 2-octaprenyl-6-methoxyphenyl hydroxylase [Vibrio hannami]